MSAMIPAPGANLQSRFKLTYDPAFAKLELQTVLNAILNLNSP